jgi:DNA-binding IclR family transcriptional regulator
VIPADQGRTKRARVPGGRLGVQSVEIGLQVVQAMMMSDDPATLTELATRAGMAPSKALRYLVSFCRGGLAVQDAQTQAYQLGPLAMQLGLTSLRRTDVVKIAAGLLPGLRDELSCTVGLAVWGNGGPCFVHVEEVRDVALITVRVGAIMPIVSSATGRMFGAHMTRQLLQPFVAAELPRARLDSENRPAAKPTLRAVWTMLEEVRRRGIARVMGEMNIGVHALAVPLFDHTGSIAGVLSALGAAGSFDARFEGATARAMSREATSISMQLGCPALLANGRNA